MYRTFILISYDTAMRRERARESLSDLPPSETRTAIDAGRGPLMVEWHPETGYMAIEGVELNVELNDVSGFTFARQKV